MGSIRSFSSSAALPRNLCGFSIATCHWGSVVGHHALGYSSSRTLGGMEHSRPRLAVGRRLRPPRSGSGFGAAGTGFGYRGSGFGYRVGGVSRPCTIKPITINEQLLQPLSLELDPNLQTAKYQEKEQIKTLNNEFASFIDKVRLLEQQNKMLKTKWSFLQAQKHCKNNPMATLGAYVGNLKQQLEALGGNKAQLETELKAAQQVLENNKKKYQDECSQRTGTESNLLALKKDADWVFLTKAELAAKVGSLKAAAEFWRMFYKEEIQQLKAQISDASVVLQMDKRQGISLDGISVDIKAQYEDVACRSQAEAQARCESKLQELRVTVGRNTDSLQEAKKKRAELAWMVQRLSGEVKSSKDQLCKLETAVATTKQRGEVKVKDAKHKLSELETALQQTKADLSWQLHKHQELLSIKLALDTEIVTYRRLLEGEESRLHTEGGFPITIWKLGYPPPLSNLAI